MIIEILSVEVKMRFNNDELRLKAIEKAWENFNGNLDIKDDLSSMIQRILKIKLIGKEDQGLAYVRFIRDIIDELLVLSRLYGTHTEKEQIEFDIREKALEELYYKKKIDKLWKHRNF